MAEIDPDKSVRKGIYIGDAMVPIVYLRDGTILVPAEEFQRSVELLRP